MRRRRRRRRKGKGRKKERTTRLEAKRRGEGEGRTDDRGRGRQSSPPPHPSSIHPSVRPSVHPSIAFPWRKENKDVGRRGRGRGRRPTCGGAATARQMVAAALYRWRTTAMSRPGPQNDPREGRKEGRGRRVALTSSSLPSHALHPSSWVLLLALPCQAVSLPTSSLPSAASFR